MTSYQQTRLQSTMHDEQNAQLLQQMQRLKLQMQQLETRLQEQRETAQPLLLDSPIEETAVWPNPAPPPPPTKPPPRHPLLNIALLSTCAGEAEHAEPTATTTTTSAYLPPHLTAATHVPQQQPQQQQHTRRTNRKEDSPTVYSPQPLPTSTGGNTRTAVAAEGQHFYSHGVERVLAWMDQVLQTHDDSMAVEVTADELDPGSPSPPWYPRSEPSTQPPHKHKYAEEAVDASFLLLPRTTHTKHLPDTRRSSKRERTAATLTTQPMPPATLPSKVDWPRSAAAALPRKHNPTPQHHHFTRSTTPALPPLQHHPIYEPWQQQPMRHQPWSTAIPPPSMPIANIYREPVEVELPRRAKRTTTTRPSKRSGRLAQSRTGPGRLPSVADVIQQYDLWPTDYYSADMPGQRPAKSTAQPRQRQRTQLPPVSRTARPPHRSLPDPYALDALPPLSPDLAELDRIYFRTR